MPPRERQVGRVSRVIPDVSYVERDLPVELTKEDRLTLGEQISQAQADMETAQAEKKATAKRFGMAIDEHKNTVSSLSQILRVGKWDKPVQVRIEINRDEGSLCETRVDTDEVLLRRLLRPEELRST